MTGVTRRAVVLSLAATSLLTLRGAPASALAPAQGLLLVDGSLAAVELLPHVSPTALASSSRLDADLVQQWRAGLRRACGACGGSVTAFVRWDKAVVLAGLAREEGKAVTSVRLSPAVFRIQLGA